MQKKIKIGVLAGGQSGEHEVSLVSAASVIKALDKEKYDVFPIGITKQGKWIGGPNVIENLKTGYVEQNFYSTLVNHPEFGRGLLNVSLKDKSIISFQEIDVIFPVLHGTYGEDGTIQGLFEMLQIPYVGCRVLASAIAMDKVIQKQLAIIHDIPTVNFIDFIKNDWEKQGVNILRHAEEKLNYPMFVKPANLGSSVAISKVKSFQQLTGAVDLALKFDRKVIIEQGLENCREIEVSVLGMENDYQISVCGEIVPDREFYDFEAKYVSNQSKLIIPAELDNQTADSVKEMAIKAFMSIDGSGLARIDFLIDNSGKVYLNEINTMPGFTSISMYPKLWQASGLEYADLLNKLIGLAFEYQEFKKGMRTDFSSGSDWYQK